jgi:hypothetical protein
VKDPQDFSFEPFASISDIPPLLSGENAVTLRLSNLDLIKSTGPTLNISDGSGCLDVLSPIVVMATLAYPRDNSARNHAIAALISRSVSRFPDREPKPDFPTPGLA